ncbi:hypothetical protein B0T19DRAFT_411202 [Cercophora scortea]|uniref:Uncharacterized protein n=1 Tax=Cercophora scortea TaxID=314031 RepID=A0AAE0J5M5_9PEZI|nr:hypothetical protein B0T19DRAFT_411202 [Cercophora scortea]
MIKCKPMAPHSVASPTAITQFLNLSLDSVAAKLLVLIPKMPLALEPPRLISMEVTRNGSADSHYRILANRQVKYITIKAGALDAASLDDMDLDFQNVLPPLPYQEDNTWKLACITRNPFSGRLEAALSSAALPGVKTIWHPQMINHLDIERTEYLALLTQECKWKADSGPERMIAKMARFYWEVQYMEAETRMYQVLEGRGIAPKFLGHVHDIKYY